jgi:hypothetical protein
MPLPSQSDIPRFPPLLRHSALSSPAFLPRWDEEVFGLEYDLDLFNIVAVDDFNMGAVQRCTST